MRAAFHPTTTRPIRAPVPTPAYTRRYESVSVPERTSDGYIIYWFRQITSPIPIHAEELPHFTAEAACTHLNLLPDAQCSKCYQQKMLTKAATLPHVRQKAKRKQLAPRALYQKNRNIRSKGR